MVVYVCVKILGTSTLFGMTIFVVLTLKPLAPLVYKGLV